MTTKLLPRPRDPIALAKLIGDIATGQVEDGKDDGKHAAMTELRPCRRHQRRRCSCKNAHVEQRAAIASKAAQARWARNLLVRTVQTRGINLRLAAHERDGINATSYGCGLMEDYESYLRSELDVARTKVRETERALELFVAWRSSKVSNRPSAVAKRAYSPTTQDAALPLPVKQRASKMNVIMDAFATAGAQGLRQDDIQRISAEHGLTSSAASLRSFCFNAKKDGRLISLAPGHYAIAPKDGVAVESFSLNEPATPRDEAAPRFPDNGDGDAASTRLDNDRHRVGDAGGGI